MVAAVKKSVREQMASDVGTATVPERACKWHLADRGWQPSLGGQRRGLQDQGDRRRPRAGIVRAVAWGRRKTTKRLDTVVCLRGTRVVV